MNRLPISLALAISFATATALCQVAYSWWQPQERPLYADQMWGLDLA